MTFLEAETYKSSNYLGESENASEVFKYVHPDPEDFPPKDHPFYSGKETPFSELEDLKPIKRISKDKLSPSQSNSGRKEKPENKKRRRNLWKILRDWKEDVNPAELVPTEVYELLEARSKLDLYKPYDLDDSPSYREKWANNPVKALILTHIQEDLKHLPPD